MTEKDINKLELFICPQCGSKIFGYKDGEIWCLANTDKCRYSTYSTIEGFGIWVSKNEE